MERIPPSAALEAQIDELLSSGLSEDGEHLAELGRLGARLVLQRAVEEEVTAFLGRARYERTLAATGSRNGSMAAGGRSNGLSWWADDAASRVTCPPTASASGR